MSSDNLADPGQHPRDFIARVDVEGGFCPDFWLELGWLGDRPRTMDEWMCSPAHEQAHGPMVFGDYDEDDSDWGAEQ